MKRFKQAISLLPIFIFGGTSVSAEEIVNLEVEANGDSSWQGVAGRVYFVQWSEDLINWDYVPTIFHGTGTHTVQYQGSSVQIYCRIKGVRIPSVNPNTEDFDDDGVSNLTELTMGLDPLSADSDGDGFSDGIEIDLGTDPKAQDHMVNWSGSAAVVLTPTN